MTEISLFCYIKIIKIYVNVASINKPYFSCCECDQTKVLKDSNTDGFKAGLSLISPKILLRRLVSETMAISGHAIQGLECIITEVM